MKIKASFLKKKKKKLVGKVWYFKLGADTHLTKFIVEAKQSVTDFQDKENMNDMMEKKQKQL